MTASKPKILVIRGGAIGDFILTLPAIAALRHQFPRAHLELLGYPHIAQLALAGGLVDRVQPIEARSLAGFFARNGPLTSELVDYFSEFDLVVSYLYDPDEIFKTNLGRCLHGQYIVGPHRPDESERIHASKVYLKPLERLAIFDANPIPHLALDTSACAPDPGVNTARRGEDGHRSTLNQLALHPGSGSERKNWPEANWTRLLEHLLQSTGLRLLLIGGEAEGERLQRLAARMPPERLEVAQSLPLADLAQRLQPCAGFVGHDSGISHLAAALGLPCLILWSDAAEEIWRPQGEQLTLIRASGGVQTISVEAASLALADLLRGAHLS